MREIGEKRRRERFAELPATAELALADTGLQYSTVQYSTVLQYRITIQYRTTDSAKAGCKI